MNETWKQDPKVKAMSPEKIKFLTDLTSQIERTPKNQLMQKFLTLTLEANKRGVSFSDQETDLLVSILSTHMSPADRGKLDTLRMISQKMASRT